VILLSGCEYCCRALFSLTVGTYVAVGSRIRVNYLGSVRELQVVRIVAENDETVDADNSSEESLISERFSSVCLSSDPAVHQCSKLQRFFRCIHGTCVTLSKPVDADSENIRSPVSLDDVGGVDYQRDFLVRFISSMLDVNKANVIKQSGELL